MEWSCNTTFAQLAIEVGAEAMHDQAEAFGFNDHYLDDLSPQADSVFPAGTNKPQTGQTGFGQFDVKATPLQMAMVAAGIANGGTVMKPYLVDEVQSADLQTLDKTDPAELSRAVSPTDRQRADQADGGHGQRGHRVARPDGRHRGGRQDRYGADRRDRQAAVRLVRAASHPPTTPRWPSR